MKAYAGIDLHSSNNYVGIIDENDKRLYGRRMPNDLNRVLMALEPFKDRIEGVVVESTFNWYWLVDGLQEHSYKVRLANPSAVKQYEGLKHTDDKWDSFWLAHMRRLDILPEGFIYPKEQRPVRDLMRRRLLFVRHRTAHILSLQSMINRNLGVKMSGNAIKRLEEKDVEDLFDSSDLVFMSKKNVAAIQFLKKIIKDIEKQVKSQVELRKEFEMLTTIPGIGLILGLTIMLEVGDIGRFFKVGNYSSYCRCVGSKRLSNGKKKGENNKKNGNKYLAWAYVEAAHFAKRKHAGILYLHPVRVNPYQNTHTAQRIIRMPDGVNQNFTNCQIRIFLSFSQLIAFLIFVLFAPLFTQLNCFCTYLTGAPSVFFHIPFCRLKKSLLHCVGRLPVQLMTNFCRVNRE